MQRQGCVRRAGGQAQVVVGGGQWQLCRSGGRTASGSGSNWAS